MSPIRTRPNFQISSRASLRSALEWAVLKGCCRPAGVRERQLQRRLAIGAQSENGEEEKACGRNVLPRGHSFSAVPFSFMLRVLRGAHSGLLLRSPLRMVVEGSWLVHRRGSASWRRRRCDPVLPELRRGPDSAGTTGGNEEVARR